MLVHNCRRDDLWDAYDGPLSREQFDEILDRPKGDRPSPNEYLDQDFIDAHLELFDEGAVRFTSQDAIDRFGSAGPDSGFVLPKSEYDRLLAETGGDLMALEDALGLDPGFLSNGDTVAAVIDPADLDNLRIPSGNEGGANDQWIPGGFTSGGVPEAVVDLSEAPFTVVPIG